MEEFDDIDDVESAEELLEMFPELRKRILDIASTLADTSRKRSSNARPDYWASVWGKMLL